MQSIRGMRDVLPAEARRWQRVETETIRTLESFGYEEIRLPLLESTELFSRGLGEATDAVEKEMYNLLDRDGEKLSLRPEGTASCVRAGLQHGLIFNQTQRLWYRGPMFRYERPQKGRYRQFEQIGAEVFGVAGRRRRCRTHPDVGDSVSFARRVARAAPRVEYARFGGFAPRVSRCAGRLSDAAPRCARRRQPAPARTQSAADTRQQGRSDPRRARRRADVDGLSRRASPRRTSTACAACSMRCRSATSSIRDSCAGSITTPIPCSNGSPTRWDRKARCVPAAATTGSSNNSAGARHPVRVLRSASTGSCCLHEALAQDVRAEPVDGYCVVLEDAHQAWAMATCQRVRDALPQLRLRLNAGGGKLKNQMKRADASGANWALIVGEDEVANDEITLKWLRADAPQERLSPAALIQRLAGWLDARDGLRE